jgi:hypothetical protein
MASWTLYFINNALKRKHRKGGGMATIEKAAVPVCELVISPQLTNLPQAVIAKAT